MGDSREDAFAARRAALDQDFRSLPAAGSAAYWERIETPDAERALALEVLGRCVRERLAAGGRGDAERIFGVISGRLRTRTEAWARHISRSVTSGQPQFAEDLAVESDFKLWQGLADPQQTFLLENFVYALDRIHQHIATDALLKHGAMRRKDVAHSSRVPSDLHESLDAPPRADDQFALSERLPDPAADDSFARADLSDLLPLVERLPGHQRVALYEHYVRNRSAEEIAQSRGVTAHTVRNWLKAGHAQVRRAYEGGEEAEHDSGQ